MRTAFTQDRQEITVSNVGKSAGCFIRISELLQCHYALAHGAHSFACISKIKLSPVINDEIQKNRSAGKAIDNTKLFKKIKYFTQDIEKNIKSYNWDNDSLIFNLSSSTKISTKKSTGKKALSKK